MANSGFVGCLVGMARVLGVLLGLAKGDLIGCLVGMARVLGVW